MKACSCCKVEKDISEFYRRRELGPNGRMSKCKKCSDTYTIEYQRNRSKTDKVFRQMKIDRMTDWRKKPENLDRHRATLRKSNKKRHKKNSETLADAHIIHVLTAHNTLKGVDIPKSLIGAKRQELLIKRELKRRNV